MCLPKKPPKPDILPDAPPVPEVAPKAPVLNENKARDQMKKKGRTSLKIDLNPASSSGLRL
jgi:hypothetical protein